MTVRAKFRVLKMTETWEKRTEVQLQPVIGKSGKSKENEEFWRYTPAGKAELTYKGGGAPFQVGAYYYVDLEESAEGDWKLSQLSLTDTSGQVRFYRGFDTDTEFLVGSLEMLIDNPPALAHFTKPGTKYRVTFTFAEPSDD